eukprot:42829-Rhodomonas_salina.1
MRPVTIWWSLALSLPPHRLKASLGEMMCTAKSNSRTHVAGAQTGMIARPAVSEAGSRLGDPTSWQLPCMPARASSAR